MYVHTQHFYENAREVISPDEQEHCSFRRSTWISCSGEAIQHILWLTAERCANFLHYSSSCDVESAEQREGI